LWALLGQNPNIKWTPQLNSCLVWILNVIWCIFVLCAQIFQVGIEGMACFPSKSFCFRNLQSFCKSNINI
jgi:hypothetical protein